MTRLPDSALGESGQKPPILIVEDDEGVRVIVGALLTFEGYPVVTARNGYEALTQARLHHPALILLDLAMPVMDGRQFRAEQRADPTIQHIPIMCFSAAPDAAIVAQELGAIECFVKPFDFDRLIEIIERHRRSGFSLSPQL
jgi:CheY-like chemotaxis protein